MSTIPTPQRRRMRNHPSSNVFFKTTPMSAALTNLIGLNGKPGQSITGDAAVSSTYMPISSGCARNFKSRVNSSNWFLAWAF